MWLASTIATRRRIRSRPDASHDTSTCRHCVLARVGTGRLGAPGSAPTPAPLPHLAQANAGCLSAAGAAARLRPPSARAVAPPAPAATGRPVRSRPRRIARGARRSARRDRHRPAGPSSSGSRCRLGPGHTGEHAIALCAILRYPGPHRRERVGKAVRFPPVLLERTLQGDAGDEKCSGVVLYAEASHPSAALATRARPH